jgi:hypothetical protein
LATSARNNSTSESASSGARGRLASSSARAATSQGHAPIAIQVYRKGVLENNLRAVNRPHALKDLGKGKPTYIINGQNLRETTAFTINSAGFL